MTAQDGDTLLEFPCRFSVKAFGPHDDEFVQAVQTLVKAHVPELTENDLSSRTSRGGRYVAVTATFNARSKAQLDAIYRALAAHPRVVMSL